MATTSSSLSFADEHPSESAESTFGSAHPSSMLMNVAKGVLDPSTGDRYVVSTRFIPRGTTIAVFGGVPISSGMLEAQLAESRISQTGFARIAIQVDEGIYLVSMSDGPADWINHSCEPNAGLQGQVVLVALRDIHPGEQICFDYATSDGSRYDEFACHCGANGCRGQVTGDDWMREELWARYGEHFSPYLRRRIEHRRR